MKIPNPATPSGGDALRLVVAGAVLVDLLLLIWLAVTNSPLPVAAQGPVGGPTVGQPWRGAPGITETVAQIMERERNAPPAAPAAVRAVPLGRSVHRKSPRAANLAAPQAAQASTPQASTSNRLPSAPNNPQPVGTSFLGAQLSESSYKPPDSMGAVGPTQILVVVNGRIKVFDKAGTLGGLDSTLNNFFSSVISSTLNNFAFDPSARYDRLSGRWLVTGLDFATPNRVLIAVSSSSTITGTSSFTFFQFQHDLVGTTPNADTGLFADYDSLGVDKFSLYIGVNVFDSLGNPTGTTGFVVNKSDLLSGTLTVTAFRQLVACSPGCSSGPFAPRGVENDDPSATEGYFIGVDYNCCSVLTIRRVTYSSITPTISANIFVSVPTTRFPINVPALGSTTPLDALDDRLFAAAIHKNKITAVNSLWTAHNIEVDSTGAACDDGYSIPCANGGRDGARWYELRNMTTMTPTLQQSGTLFDPATSTPRFFWIPSVTMSGQGHMALGSSTAVSTTYAGIAVAGRLTTDPLSTTQTFTLAVAGAGSYNIGFEPACSCYRWGDYSQTVVDPNDDMTMWTFQEYANATNSWGVQVIQLKAPPPVTPTTASPSSVAQGQAFVNVTITGTSISGSGFFDPGPDTGGPGFLKHIAATVTGGVIVNSVSFTDPTHVTLNISTFCASAGSQDITITNPDGQSATGSGILTITPASTNCVRNYLPLISK